ncbi:MAG: NAD(P)H-binding protein [Actinobacteria bacterium]|nr:NAD(P)H-binding protein [Actinomycetota bacterium]
MKIVVFGASGRTGRKVVEQALGRGHQATAFVPDASRYDAAGANVVEGDARDADAVGRALEENVAVITVLSLRSAEAEPEHSEAIRTIVDAAERAAVRRIVVTANNDVFADDEATGEFAAHAREHRRNRDRLRASGLDWTIGAAPLVVDGSEFRYDAVVDGKAPGRKISTADFASFTLDALERDEWTGHIVGVSSADQTGPQSSATGWAVSVQIPSGG